MTPNKPYLIRAFNDWILDNECTPYILVDAEFPNVYVPGDYVQDGQIVFNITPGIVAKLMLGNDAVEFDARFAGQPMHVYIPVQAILAIYAKENGNGMMFDQENQAAQDQDGSDDEPPSGSSGGQGKGRPNLRVVK